jgi:hypothetical protein
MHRQNNDIDGFVYVPILDKIYTNFFLKLIIGRTKNSKIAIEPMNRKQVRPFRATKKQRSEQSREKQLRSKSCRFRAMRPSGEFPDCLRVSKRFFR